MNIQKKIEAIKREPEHVRIRYVWGCVIVSMIFISSIWLFSITAMFKKGSIEAPEQSSLTDLKKQFEEVNKQAPSLTDLSKSMDLEKAAVNGEDQTNEVAQPSEEIPESSAYSKDE